MKRRSFVLVAGIGISVIAIPTWYYIYGKTELETSLTSPELLSYICDDKTINDIGSLYRKEFSDENSEQKLLELLFNHGSTTPDPNNELLNKQIIDDYHTENTIMIDGWVLSRTEARQCALFSLSQNN
ncbi:hypothetical protein [Maribacter arcticus]|jgi:hypothetical protein|uniref:hypothetical protein n=1 Tax=Maribacter arcticus TaxID=561365 RepID=UPI003001DEC1